MGHRAIVKKLSPLLLSILLITLSACAVLETRGTTPPKAPKPPRTSPAKTVVGYLDALKEADFMEAYEFITMGYASNLDKESYKINMEQSLVKRYNWRLSNYEVLSVRILGSLSYVVARLSVQYSPANTKPTTKTIDIQYELNPIDGKWKITADKCIENCMSADDLREGSINSN